MVKDMLRRQIAKRVSAVFNDRARGESPVVRQSDGLFGPSAVAWQVHGDVTTMMIGGVASLLLQMLHPAVLAGVWDHSNFRSDMHGRLRRTARFIAVTTYSGKTDAVAAIAHVRAIHETLSGTLPDGTHYRADDPSLLAWVHVTEAISFLDAWRRYADPAMTLAQQDRYFAEVAQIGVALGAAPVPKDRAAAERLIEEMRPLLRADARTRDVAARVLSHKADNFALTPALGLTMRAAIDLLPSWARGMHGVELGNLERSIVRTGATGVAHTLRWAFGQPRMASRSRRV